MLGEATPKRSERELGVGSMKLIDDAVALSGQVFLSILHMSWNRMPSTVLPNVMQSVTVLSTLSLWHALRSRPPTDVVC